MPVENIFLLSTLVREAEVALGLVCEMQTNQFHFHSHFFFFVLYL